jgi:hypothetical protein
VTLYRSFAWSSRAKAGEPDGPLWIPRPLQGDGRHDNPDLYGCLYLAEHELSTVVEQLARFRTQRLIPSMLQRRGLPLALAVLECDPAALLIDLDDPQVLLAHALRPSRVATRIRAVTQPQARALYEVRPEAAGVRWWSTYEAGWMNVTLFDRGVHRLTVSSVRRLAIDDPVVAEAAEFLGLRPAP